MSSTLEFWFDFSSPYGYIASHKVDALAANAGRVALWRPFMLGVVFKESGNSPLLGQPVKGDYSLHDLKRVARYMDVPFVLPDPFPIATLAAARAFYWLEDRDAEMAKAFARAAFKAYFADGIDISVPGLVADIAAGCGADGAALLSALAEPAVKQRLKDVTAEALAKGVCGSPFFIVDGEGFWGSDRMWMVKKWMQSGGW